MTSSDQISPQHLTEIKALIERAHIEIGEVAEQGPRNRWRMHVPADPSRDTDLIISEALKGAEDLAAEVDRLNARLSKTLDKIDRVARIRPVEHGCDDGSIFLFVYADHLRAALGITPDGTAVAP